MTGPHEPSLTPSDPVDFSALIMGFSSAALYYMGVAPVAGKIATTNELRHRLCYRSSSPG